MREERVAAPDAEPGYAEKHRLWSEAGQRALRELPLEGWARMELRDPLAGERDIVTVVHGSERKARIWDAAGVSCFVAGLQR